MRRARVSRRAHIDAFLLLPVIGPVVLMLAGNANFMFDAPGWLDPFAYTGYFWHYSEHLANFDAYYKVSRLPWILPGVVMHRLLNEVAASYALHGTVLIGSTIALYVLLRNTLEDRCVAAVTSAAWSCCTWVHGNGGWDYHIGITAAYYLVALCALVYTGRGARAPWTPIIAGASFAAAVHTHLFMVAFVPIALLSYWASSDSNRESLVGRFCKDAALGLLGAIALTVLLAIVSRADGGRWGFFVPQIDYTRWLSRPGNNQWHQPIAAWLPGARYMVIPSLALVAGLWAAISKLRSGWPTTPRARHAIAFVLQGWLAFAVLSYYQFARGQNVLDTGYLAFPLYFHAFPAMGAALESRRPRPWRLDFTLALVCTAIIAVPLLLWLPHAIPSKMTELAAALHIPGKGSVVASLVVGMGLVLLVGVVPTHVRLAAFALAFGLMNAWTVSNATSYGIHTVGVNRDMLGLARQIDRFTARIDPTLAGIKYWFTVDRVPTLAGTIDMAPVFDSYVSTRGWLGNLAGSRSPGRPIEELSLDDFERARCLAVLSAPESHDGLRTRIERRFRELRHPLVNVAHSEFHQGLLAASITVFALPTSSQIAQRTSLCNASG